MNIVLDTMSGHIRQLTKMTSEVRDQLHSTAIYSLSPLDVTTKFINKLTDGYFMKTANTSMTLKKEQTEILWKMQTFDDAGAVSLLIQCI